MDVKDYILKYWIKKKINKWEYLFKSNKKNTNLYFIVKWWILLTKNNNNIALVWKWEILWEKSFLENINKPIDWIAEIDTEYLVITLDIFNNIDNLEKISFLKSLTLFISNRVDRLNTIVKIVSNISLDIVNIKWNISFEKIKEIFNDIFILEKIYTYKYVWDSIMLVYESSFDNNLHEIVYKYKNIKKWFSSVWNNKYIINVWDFCFILEWTTINSDYIMNNVILNSMASFNYLWWLLEKQKENNLQDFLE